MVIMVQLGGQLRQGDERARLTPVEASLYSAGKHRCATCLVS